MEKQLLNLRPSDVLTKNILARSTSLDLVNAENILIDLFNEKKLNIVIRVPCNGEDDHKHYKLFKSLKDYYEASARDDICEFCDETIEWKKAVVGFKKGVYTL